MLIERAAWLKARLLARLRGGGDRGHEMLGNRLAIATSAGTCFRQALPEGQTGSLRPRPLCLGCCLDALLLVAHALLNPEPSKKRCLVCGSALNQPWMLQAHCPELAGQR